MKIDMHVHLADIDALLKAQRDGPVQYATRHMSRMIRHVLTNCPTQNQDRNISEQWIERLASWVKESQLDKVVLLALDSAFDDSGELRPEKTMLHVDNDFVSSAVARHPEFMFGASIHPYRKDAVKELERLVKKGACLIKWIPSGQHIEPDNPKCFSFYEAMNHYSIPLLSHTGVEHTLGRKRSSYNHPAKLVPALDRGVTVIAAHCGAHLFLHEQSHFKAWSSLAEKHENFYGDSGAFSIVTRIPYLRHILKDKVLQNKILYGSDFPGIPATRWCWQLGIRKMRELSKLTNPLERNIRVMQALKMPSQTFELAAQLLLNNKEILTNEC